jgi:hypothetical protein
MRLIGLNIVVPNIAGLAVKIVSHNYMKWGVPDSVREEFWCQSSSQKRKFLVTHAIGSPTRTGSASVPEHEADVALLCNDPAVPFLDD